MLDDNKLNRFPVTRLYFRWIALVLLISFLFLNRTAYATCGDIALDGARDRTGLIEAVQACIQEERITDAELASMLGYVYRNGYGIPRNLEYSSVFFQRALSLQSCEPFAVCGLRGLSNSDSTLACDVDCGALTVQTTLNDSNSEEVDTTSKAYQLLAELIRSNPTQTRTVENLKSLFTQIVDQEEQRLNEAYLQLCTSHIKQAVVTISLAHQLNREINRRGRLIEHHEAKLKSDGNARSQAALQQLYEVQRRFTNNKRVFFEKYAKAVFSTSRCDKGILNASYSVFEQEIAEVSVTEMEQSAYRLFQQHVQDATAQRGMNSTWFNKLDELLNQ